MTISKANREIEESESSEEKQDPFVPFVFSVNAYCSREIEKMEVKGSFEECAAELHVHTSEACPQDNFEKISKKVDEVTKQIYETLSNLGKWWGAILIPCGLVLVFFGFKMIQFTFALLIFITVSMLLFLLFVLFIFSTSLTTTKLILVAIFSIFAGGAASYKGSKYTTKYGIAILAAFGMLSLSFIIVPLIGLHGVQYENLIKLSIYFVSGVLGFVGAAYFSNGIQVFVTAFIGAYFVIRGISLFAGGFINEFSIMDKNDDDDDEVEIKPEFMAYIAGLFILFIIGVLVQRRQIKKNDDKYKDENNKATVTLLK
mmetsp:Transcript_5178/g.8785  ORF Transcript_5178/g.8785 Transcript_5178/m.8785 type:complete len:315 (-) Transcript_5178:45-989(-)